MKMHEINESQLDEVGGIGKAMGKAAKSVAKGAADFGRGFKAGYTGNKKSAPSKRGKTTSNKVSNLQKAISNLNTRELQAIKKQIVKQARTAK